MSEKVTTREAITSKILKVWNLSKGLGGVKPQIQTLILLVLKYTLGTVSVE